MVGCGSVADRATRRGPNELPSLRLRRGRLPGENYQTKSLPPTRDADRDLGTLTVEAPRPGTVDVPEQWLVLVTCRNEKQQVGLLERFRREGVECRALVS